MANPSHCGLGASEPNGSFASGIFSQCFAAANSLRWVSSGLCLVTLEVGGDGVLSLLLRAFCSMRVESNHLMSSVGNRAGGGTSGCRLDL